MHILKTPSDIMWLKMSTYSSRYAMSLYSDIIIKYEHKDKFNLTCLTLKAPNKNYSRRHFNILLSSLEEKKA